MPINVTCSHSNKSLDVTHVKWDFAWAYEVVKAKHQFIMQNKKYLQAMLVSKCLHTGSERVHVTLVSLYSVFPGITKITVQW